MPGALFPLPNCSTLWPDFPVGASKDVSPKRISPTRALSIPYSLSGWLQHSLLQVKFLNLVTVRPTFPEMVAKRGRANSKWLASIVVRTCFLMSSQSIEVLSICSFLFSLKTYSFIAFLSEIGMCNSVAEFLPEIYWSAAPQNPLCPQKSALLWFSSFIELIVRSRSRLWLNSPFVVVGRCEGMPVGENLGLCAKVEDGSPLFIYYLFTWVVFCLF